MTTRSMKKTRASSTAAIVPYTYVGRIVSGATNDEARSVILSKITTMYVTRVSMTCKSALMASSTVDHIVRNTTRTLDRVERCLSLAKTNQNEAGMMRHFVAHMKRMMFVLVSWAKSMKLLNASVRSIDADVIRMCYERDTKLMEHVSVFRDSSIIWPN